MLTNAFHVAGWLTTSVRENDASPMPGDFCPGARVACACISRSITAPAKPWCVGVLPPERCRCHGDTVLARGERATLGLERAMALMRVLANLAAGEDLSGLQFTVLHEDIAAIVAKGACDGSCDAVEGFRQLPGTLGTGPARGRRSGRQWASVCPCWQNESFRPQGNRRRRAPRRATSNAPRDSQRPRRQPRCRIAEGQTCRVLPDAGRECAGPACRWGWRLPVARPSHRFKLFIVDVELEAGEGVQLELGIAEGLAVALESVLGEGVESEGDPAALA